jgi:hypothetical protein
MRLDAVSDLTLAAFLLAASWDDLYTFLGLPLPRPEFYAQLLGAALVAVAVVEWKLAGKAAQREVAFGVAVGRVIGAVVLIVWLASGELGLDAHGAVLLWSIAGALVLEAILHTRIWLSLRDRP